jgi:hypothetical protein
MPCAERHAASGLPIAGVATENCLIAATNTRLMTVLDAGSMGSRIFFGFCGDCARADTSESCPCRADSIEFRVRNGGSRGMAL